MTNISFKELNAKLIPAALEAGQYILTLYKSNIEVLEKSDQSPVTIADRGAEKIIFKALNQNFTDITAVGEESYTAESSYLKSDLFFLVDPLDGTREFIHQREEFTVNIALVQNNRPHYGLIFAPALGELFLTISENQAAKYRFEAINNIYIPDIDCFTPVFCRLPVTEKIAIASRSHRDKETDQFLADQGIQQTICAGSSLKFCRLAEGKADLYPRFGPTKEWDTAAGHAILLAAGGTLTQWDGSWFEYGKWDQEFLNPSFIATGKVNEDSE